MPGQRSITAFLKPTMPSKRNTEVSNGSPVKRLKSSSAENGISLSPDQQKRMQDNQLQARIKLQSKRTPALSANIGPSWFKALEQEFSKDYFKKLSGFLENERKKHTVYPPEDQVFSWTRHSEINKVKVVILGQDPYHNPNQAHGLSFSVVKGVDFPPSLRNMFLELKQDIPGFTVPSHGDLTGWAEQGVLMLNACLTVRAHSANSHKDQGWENLTDAVIRWLSNNLTGVVFLLWGAYAQKKGEVIDKKKHLILKCAHPSPLSASRGFFGCRHYSKANEYLEKIGKKPIDWCHLP